MSSAYRASKNYNWQIFVFAFSVLSISFFFNTQSTSALWCGSNYSTQNACDQYDAATGGRGALWFNDTPGGNESDSVNIRGATGSVTLYLHGAVYNGIGTDFYANNIHVVTQYTEGDPYEISFDEEPSIKLNDNSIYRGFGNDDGGWSVDWQGSWIEAALDIEEFRATASSCGSGCYEKTVHVYRCFGEEYTGSPGTCYSDPAVVHIDGLSSFTTHPTAKLTGADNGVIYTGTSIERKLAVTIGTNNNPNDHSGTATPDNTIVQAVDFYLGSGTPYDASKLKVQEADGGYGHVCDILRARFGTGGGQVVDCAELAAASGSLGQGERILSSSSGKIEDGDRIGQKYCVAVGIRPASNDSGNWKTSNIACRTIAKKPLVQVKDGSISTKGSITTSLSEKQNGVFGSWVEYLAISNGQINHFSSGSYLNSRRRDSTKDDCVLSPLTIANNQCSSGSLGKAKVTQSKTFLNNIEKIISNPPGRVDVEKHNGNVTITGDTISASSALSKPTKIIYATGNIEIANNYKIQGTTSSPYTLPQFIIVAKGNINIRENVDRLDAVLISSKDINTCSNVSERDLTSDRCNTPLVINGAIYANAMKLRRTAGAGAGAASGNPAEELDLTPAVYLWANSQSANSMNQVTEVNVRELAPRL